MARPQEQNVTQRRAIATIEDQNKYSMPDGRRLRVFAEPLRMNVEAEVPQTVRLAEALAQVKPDVLNFVIDQQSTKNAQEVQAGILDRTKNVPPEVAKSEWRQYGYEHQSAYMAGEDLGTKLETDVAQRDTSIPFEVWYQEWWKNNAQNVPNVPEHTSTFNKVFSKSLVKAREKDTENILTLQKEQQVSTATESIFRGLKEIRSKGLPVTTTDWDVMKKGLAKGFSNPETDELFYNALERYALENNDPDALNVLYERRGEVPSLIDNPKYTQKIVALRERVRSKKVQEATAKEKERNDLLKGETDQFEQNVRFKLIGIGQIEDPVRRSAALDDIRKEVEDGGKKYVFSSGFLGILESRIAKTDKGEATAFQEQTYRQLYTADAGQSAIDKAVAEGNITQAQWDKLMSKKQQEADRAKRLEDKGQKPPNKLPSFKEAEQSIKFRAGFNPLNSTPDSKETQVNAGLGLERFRELVEDKIDDGLEPKEAIKQAKDETIKFMTDTGLVSKLAVTTENKVNKLEAIRKNPLSYYDSNIKDFITDLQANKLPPTLTPEQKAQLQRKALLEVKKNKPTVTKTTQETKVN